MELENSSLYREVRAVIESPVKPVHYVWAADIHTPTSTYRVLKVLSIDFVCDYEAAYADTVLVTVAVLGGVYAKRIYPAQSELDITLYRTPLREQGSTADYERDLEVERYTATMIDAGNPLLEGNAGSVLTEEALNATNIFEITFQLVNKSLEQMRMISVGGVYRYVTAEDVIKGILTRESKRLQVEGIRMPQGVDMVPASNTAVRNHVIIPQGTKLVDIPAYVQNKCGGVYSSGMGYYLQGDYWYVYPCFDVTRFAKANRTMTIINIPPNKFPGVERTYRKDGNSIVVLATGEVRFRDDTDSQQLNSGNGVRFADATLFMEGYSKTKDNVTTVARGANVSEFLSSSRPNGKNNVQISDQPITANPFAEYSKLSRREGSLLSLVWENSQPSAVFPGMMVKLLYLEEDEIKTTYGVMLKAHHYVSMVGEGMASERHKTNSALSVFVQKKAI